MGSSPYRGKTSTNLEKRLKDSNVAFCTPCVRGCPSFAFARRHDRLFRWFVGLNMDEFGIVNCKTLQNIAKIGNQKINHQPLL